MNHKLQALQILRLLAECYHSTKIAILDQLDLSEGDFDTIYTDLFSESLELEECGCCGAYHRPDFEGDCRNDAERF